MCAETQRDPLLYQFDQTGCRRLRPRGPWPLGHREPLHWVLDVVFHDDLALLRIGYGPQNMAVIKHMALNLLSAAKLAVSLKNRTKRAGWNPDYLAALIHGTA